MKKNHANYLLQELSPGTNLKLATFSSEFCCERDKIICIIFAFSFQKQLPYISCSQPLLQGSQVLIIILQHYHWIIKIITLGSQVLTIILQHCHWIIHILTLNCYFWGAFVEHLWYSEEWLGTTDILPCNNK